VAPDERSSRVLERCDRHPGVPAVARCDECGRPMCLACSTPVRGRTYGSECLATVLGPDAPTAIEPRPVRPDLVTRVVMVVAFGVAALATTLPWSRFGPGSGAFGAWTRSGRWSLVAAVASVAGLILAAVSLARPEPSRPRDVACAALGAAVALAAALSVMFPPAFSRPWLGPWAALVSGLIACGASLVALRSPENETADI
jgi:hypothetical protein